MSQTARKRLRSRLSSRRDGLGQRLPANQLAHVIGHARGAARGGVHGYDPGVLQRRGEPGLRLEPQALARVTRENGLELFQRHLAAELLVERDEHVARSPAVKEAKDAEPPARPGRAWRRFIVAVEVDVHGWGDERYSLDPQEDCGDRLDAVRKPPLVLGNGRVLADEAAPVQLEGEQLPEQLVAPGLRDRVAIHLDAR